MALTSAQQVRFKIQDQPLIADTTHVGDGSAAVFALPHRNLTSGTAYVPGVGGWTATGASFDASGFVSLSGVVSANSAFRVRYSHSTFSDDEIDHMLTIGGSVLGAALDAVETLMFDGLKRAAWTAPDGSSYDDTAAMGALRDLYTMLKDSQGDEATVAGSIDSWSLNQGDY